jgi:hypothetical protein
MWNNHAIVCRAWFTHKHIQNRYIDRNSIYVDKKAKGGNIKVEPPLLTSISPNGHRAQQLPSRDHLSSESKNFASMILTSWKFSSALSSRSSVLDSRGLSKLVIFAICGSYLILGMSPRTLLCDHKIGATEEISLFDLSPNFLETSEQGTPADNAVVTLEAVPKVVNPRAGCSPVQGHCPQWSSDLRSSS